MRWGVVPGDDLISFVSTKALEGRNLTDRYNPIRSV